MSADPIVYCLEHLTDYMQFERLCSDLMSECGYPEIEPLGGTNDKGRDALYVSPADSTTILAYSVRGDWRQKLAEDCARIRDQGHTLQSLVFVCTATFSATDRDAAVERVATDFGWSLDLYGMERIRVLLAGRFRHVLANHPAIFCPPFFTARGGLALVEARDTIVIDHAWEDHALASWLGRRLQLAGYKVWCLGAAPVAGENVDESVRSLIRLRALRYLPVISTRSVRDADFIGRLALAASQERLTIPCRATEVPPDRLPGGLKSIASLPFDESWSAGLRGLLEGLAAAQIRPSKRPELDRAIALRSYVPEPVTRSVVETVYTNTFPVHVPASIYECHLRRPLTTDEQTELRESWAFVVANATTLLAFDHPPAAVPLEPGPRIPQYGWQFEERHRRSNYVVKELIQRSLDVACRRAGMQWCEDRRVFYFPQDKKPRLSVPFVHVDGRATRVALAGQKTYGWGDRAEPFRYQLCPKFRAWFDEAGGWSVTLRLYVRVTNVKGQPHEKKAIIRRRKTVTKSWWNNHFLARTLGMMQALSDGAPEIVIGTGKRGVVVQCRPLAWECPVSIDYEAVERLGDFQSEMAQLLASRLEPESSPDTGDNLV